MKDKKHIDKLFKDRFSDFDVSPSPEVWGSIQASLEKGKKDRNLIPLWWKLGGVAALLALFLTVGNSVFNSSDIDAPIVVTDETTRSIENDTEKNPLIKEADLNEEGVASEEEASKTISNELENASEEKMVNNSNSKEVIYKKIKSTQEGVAVETKASEMIQKKAEGPTQKNKLFKDNISTAVDSKKEAVAVTTNKSNSTSEKKIQKNDDLQNTIGPLIKKDISVGETIDSEVAITEKSEDKTQTETSQTDIAKTEENKQSILDAIEEQKLIKEEEAVAEEMNNIDRRWEVAPNFAPVYYSSLGSGSSIDPAFADNSQTGDVNFSYGVQVSYALSERLTVRSGLSNVDLSYSTAGVELGTGPVSAALQSVDYGGRSTVLTVVDKGALKEDNMNGGFGDITPKSTNGEAKLIQNISYYEVPLELKYAVLTNKIGVNLIGGLSTLFLGSSEVSVSAGDFESTLGEANNLSSVSFSTNVGLGFDYKFSKKFKFNIEPMFKYQLNPYSDSSVDFKPYYLGVYTGISYKF